MEHQTHTESARLYHIATLYGELENSLDQSIDVHSDQLVTVSIDENGAKVIAIKVIDEAEDTTVYFDQNFLIFRREMSDSEISYVKSNTLDFEGERQKALSVTHGGRISRTDDLAVLADTIEGSEMISVLEKNNQSIYLER